MSNKYPNQVYSVKRKSKVLGVDAMFFAPTENDSPFEMHAGYSRAVLTLLDSSGSKMITYKCNIPATEIPYVYEKTKAIMNAPKTTAAAPDDGMSSRPAYTQKLFDKRFKGKTPAEVLLANAEDEQNLLQIKDWLSQNIAKYPANKAQIDAIEDAINLLKIGELKEHVGSADNGGTVIYSTDYKFMTTKNEAGHNLIYSVSVVYEPAMKYPYNLNITNCYAPVKTEANGQKNIQMSEATGMMKSSLAMSEAEWFTVMDRLMRTLNNFENNNFPKLYADVQKASYFATK